MSKNLFFSLWISAVSAFGQLQTSHDDDGSGQSNTVTLYLRSRTILDRGLLDLMRPLLANADPSRRIPTMPASDLWQHGHPGEQQMRVTVPRGPRYIEAKKWQLRDFSDVRDSFEIDLVVPQDCQGANCYTAAKLNSAPKIGVLRVFKTRLPGGAGLFSNGHLFGDAANINFECKVAGQVRRYKGKADWDALWNAASRGDALAAKCLTDGVIDRLKKENSSHGARIEDVMNTAWVFSARLDGPSGPRSPRLIWESKHPSDANTKEASKPKVSDKVCKSGPCDQPEPDGAKAITWIAKKPHSRAESATLAYRLKLVTFGPNDLPVVSEQILMRELRILRAGQQPAANNTADRIVVPPGGLFTICRNGEDPSNAATYGKPICPPLPGLQSTAGGATQDPQVFQQ